MTKGTRLAEARATDDALANLSLLEVMIKSKSQPFPIQMCIPMPHGRGNNSNSLCREVESSCVEGMDPFSPPRTSW
jgi:hypothetical protein